MRSLLSNDDGGCSRRNFNAVHARTDFEWLTYQSVGIHRQEKILNQKIERLPIDRNSRDFYALHVHGRLPIGRMEANGNSNRTLSIEQFRHQPSRRMALRATELTEINQRRSRCRAGAKFYLGITHARRHFVRGPGGQLLSAENHAGAGAQVSRFNLVELFLCGSIVRICGAECSSGECQQNGE